MACPLNEAHRLAVSRVPPVGLQPVSQRHLAETALLIAGSAACYEIARGIVILHIVEVIDVQVVPTYNG